MTRRPTAPAALLICLALLAACTSSPAPSGVPPPTGGPTGSPVLATESTTPAAAPSSRPGASGTPGPATAAPSHATGSSAPTASTAPPTATAAPTALTAGWPVYHRDAARSGYDPTFPAPIGGLTIAWRRSLDGAVYGQPIVVGGQVIAATENDSVYALNPATGRIIWRAHLGTPVRLSTLPCGNIDPLGITGTPAFDPVARSIFVVAEVSGPRHVLFALDPATGSVRWSRNVDLAGHDPLVHQQRTALAVGNDYVYFGYGGLAGDCGAYRGAVVGVPTSGHGATIAYEVPVRREGGIWATAGPVLDSHGNVYVSVGNGSSTTTYDGSDSVLKLSPGLHLLSRFAPTNWASDNAADLDLGSLSPVFLTDGFVFIAGKRGTGYTLRQSNLGGIGGEVVSAPVCAAFGGAAVQGSTIFLPCQGELREVRVGADGSIRTGWRGPAGPGGPPVLGGGLVWSIDVGAGELYALDPASGATRARVAIGSVPHFASPTLADGRVLVGTLAGVVAVRARG